MTTFIIIAFVVFFLFLTEYVTSCKEVRSNRFSLYYKGCIDIHSFFKRFPRYNRIVELSPCLMLKEEKIYFNGNILEPSTIQNQLHQFIGLGGGQEIEQKKKNRHQYMQLD